MAMRTIQVRLPEKIIQEIEKEVKDGNYESKSDYIRNKLRYERDFEKMIGIIPNTGDSVKEVRELRKKWSKKITCFEDIKTFDELIK